MGKINPKPYMKRHKDDWLVGARGKVRSDGSYYEGPVARISYDEDWLNFVTDDYEGNASINIEALPALRRALAQIAREIRNTKKAEGLADGGEQGTASSP